VRRSLELATYSISHIRPKERRFAKSRRIAKKAEVLSADSVMPFVISEEAE
jgi:hypothetical protein